VDYENYFDERDSVTRILISKLFVNLFSFSKVFVYISLSSGMFSVGAKPFNFENGTLSY